MSKTGTGAHADFLTEPGNAARYDELLQPGGAIRPQWLPLIQELRGLSVPEYERRAASAREMIRSNAVTYNVYDENEGETRPWQLEIMPFVISAADWSVIEAGVAQRAWLADAILADIYGPQKLIAERRLPPHLVVGHPQFLRPLMGIVPPGKVRVHLYSCDLVRTPDGNWMVSSLRADTPSGMGYALENRIAVSQTFPDLFRDMRVARLASFFQHFRQSVLSLAGKPEPRAVLLTPGPYNEAYFEHAYLAHYLGLSLVEGDDLAVRNGEVFLKTLAGLERIDVVFRRVDSRYCDPLELASDSVLGVPGLVDAARAGGVVLANALGGNVTESPALAAYLPGLAQALLGEALKIPDMPTLWCGTGTSRAEALAHLDGHFDGRLGGTVLRKAFDSQPLFSRYSTARLCAELSTAERARFADEIGRRGAGFVVQRMPEAGLAPVFEKNDFAPRPFTLRVYAAWTPDGYKVMPGGLTWIGNERTRGGPRGRDASMQSGAASKDTWVQSDGPVDFFSLLPPSNRALTVRRAGDEAPSRAMDNLFWLGRYAERAENLVRVLRAIVQRLGENAAHDSIATAADLARRLLVPLAQTSIAATEAAAEGDETRLAIELQALIWDRGHSQGLQKLLSNVQRTAWSVRDRLSLDTWRTVYVFSQPETVAAAAPWDAAGAQTYLDALVRRSAALAGLSAENMVRGRNWLFFDMGRRVERIVHTVWLIRQTMANSDESEMARFQLALEIADSAMTYRYRYLNIFQAAPVLDLLLLDETNPRAVLFQIAMLANDVEPLPRLTPVQTRQLDKAILNVTLRRVKGAEASALAETDERGRRRVLGSLLEKIEDSTNRFSDAIADAYFQHARRQRTGAMPSREAR